jgi:hypothetical protein
MGRVNEPFLTRSVVTSSWDRRAEFPWYDPKLLDPERQRQIADLGFNVVRLGAMWTGVEPEEDQFNKTYLVSML